MHPEEVLKFQERHLPAFELLLHTLRAVGDCEFSLGSNRFLVVFGRITRIERKAPVLQGTGPIPSCKSRFLLVFAFRGLRFLGVFTPVEKSSPK